MDEKQLDLNAPLLSVRRLSTVSSTLEGLSCDNRRRSRPRKQSPLISRSEWEPEKDVNKPAGIPFLWEQIPGKAKHRKKPTRLASGRVSNEEISASSSDNNEGDEDVYVDAVETLSSNESFSWNGGDENTDMETLESFSSYSRTRDYLMNRFLPAAKSVIDQNPLYISKKQEPVLSVTKGYGGELRPLLFDKSSTSAVSQFRHSGIVKNCDELEGDRKKSSTKICGCFVPRLCAKDSLYLSPSMPVTKPKVHQNPRINRLRMKESPETEIRSTPMNRSSDTGMSDMLSSPFEGSCGNESFRPSVHDGVRFLGEMANKGSQAAAEKALCRNQVETGRNLKDLEVGLAPPLPKSPSQSWVWSKKMMTTSSATKLQQQAEAAKSPKADPKPETIVTCKSEH